MRTIINALVPGSIEKDQLKISIKDFKSRLMEVEKYRNDTLKSLDSSLDPVGYIIS